METEASLGDSGPSPVYGPVHSWRLGWSLGIDLLLETSICSFNCVYCQLGQIQRITREQRVYVPTERVARDLKAVDWAGVDVLTFSGSGEPTLALNLDEAIARVKAMSGKPVMILTNATQLQDAATRARVLEADRVVCKLDAATDATLASFNRAAPGIRVADIVDGIKRLRAEYRGILSLQCMFMPANVGEAEGVARLAAEIGPDEIQINTPRRPYPKAWFLGARGTHDPANVPNGVKLKTLTHEQLEHIERLMRRHVPGAALISPLQKQG